MKETRSKRLQFFWAILGLLILAFAVFTYVREKEGFSMKCQTLDLTQTRIIANDFMKLPLYTPGTMGRSQVRFSFAAKLKNTADMLFLIMSNRMGKPVYRGPYVENVIIDIDNELTIDDGYDNLEFKILQIERQQVCTWNNERGYPYWQPGAEIEIEFLAKGYFDDDNLFVEHGVKFRDKLK